MNIQELEVSIANIEPEDSQAWKQAMQNALLREFCAHVRDSGAGQLTVMASLIMDSLER